ncbi:DUF6382 domain-containing protein [Paenibacillus puldeungensis]|uniref:DUF6382 domain-containing protein n=1 Tax=Paenibacillus puldeungensis TaxID=696536 RepID=A0ABW3RRX1_9BACL
MPDLYADFVRNGGTYMILRAAGEELHSEHLNRVQRAMLASVSVPNLLRLDIREVDFEVSLHYDITGKRMLSHSLRSDKIGMPEFYSLLLQIVTMLDECKRYMLFPANFLLDEEHIFVEDMLSCGILYFTYVPLKEPMEDRPLSQSLLMLTTRLLTSVSRVEGEGIQHIVKFCGEEQFSLPELKRMLLQLLSAGPSIEDEYSSSRHVETGKKRSDMRLEQPAIEYGRSKPNMKSDTWGASSGAIVNEYLPSNQPISTNIDNWSEGGAKPEREHWPGVEDDTVQKVSIKPTYYILGALLIDALCWKYLYLDHPGSIMKYISLAITFLLAIAVYMLWSGRLHILGFGGSQGSSSMVNQEHEESTSIEHLGHSSINSFDGFDNLRYLGQEEKWGKEERSKTLSDPLDPPLVSRSYELRHIPEKEEIKESVEYQEQGLSISRSAPPQPATVLLQKALPSERPGQEREEGYFLDRYTAAGIGPERIPLKAGSFVIGRSEEIVQYVESTHGVSRAHVEIMNRREGCSLKDLGSRNGTLLNGEQMAPYKEYPIEQGDVFRLADVSFKIGKEPAQA